MGSRGHRPLAGPGQSPGLPSLIATATQLVHVALMLALAPIVSGYIGWARARLTGRIGPSPLQPWRDLLRLARKQPVMAENATWLFRTAPVAVFAATLAAAALVPGFALGMATANLADLLVIAGLLALARCILALAALDTGTAFGGIGGSREMTYAGFAGPALLLVVFTLALTAGSTNLETIARALREGAAGSLLPLGLALPALLMVAIAENGRVPVDDRAALAEPGMAHAAMTLEYSGRHLALLEAEAALKLLLWVALIAAIFVPFGAATPESGLFTWLLALPVWGLKLTALASALALFETVVAGMRVFRVPEVLGLAVLLAALAALAVFIRQGLA